MWVVHIYNLRSPKSLNNKLMIYFDTKDPNIKPQNKTKNNNKKTLISF